MMEPNKHPPAVNLDRELAADRAKSAIEWLRDWANEPMSVEKLMLWTETGGVHAHELIDQIERYVQQLEAEDKT